MSKATDSGEPPRPRARRGQPDLQRYVQEHGVEAELIELDVPTPTVAAAAAALGVSQSLIVKSILFIAEPDSAVLALAPGPRQIAKRAIARWLGMGEDRIRLATPAEALRICGYEVGSVPPIGHGPELPVCLDRSLMDLDQVYAGGGAVNSLLRIAPGEIKRAARAVLLDLASESSS